MSMRSSSGWSSAADSGAGAGAGAGAGGSTAASGSAAGAAAAAGAGEGSCAGEGSGAGAEALEGAGEANGLTTVGAFFLDFAGIAKRAFRASGAASTNFSSFPVAWGAALTGVGAAAGAGWATGVTAAVVVGGAPPARWKRAASKSSRSMSSLGRAGAVAGGGAASSAAFFLAGLAKRSAFILERLVSISASTLSSSRLPGRFGFFALPKSSFRLSENSWAERRSSTASTTLLRVSSSVGSGEPHAAMK
mmetsp:Transcript_10272/g.41822  ORF Transcript_10272/g.41822 Transcript_10272/m.41822 type:complete len:249 (-) Transcript_10272:1330-2076(-)